eukprot:58149_1
MKILLSMFRCHKVQGVQSKQQIKQQTLAETVPQVVDTNDYRNRFDDIGPDIIEYIFSFVLPCERFKCLRVDKSIHHILLKSHNKQYPHSSKVRGQLRTRTRWNGNTKQNINKKWNTN